MNNSDEKRLLVKRNNGKFGMYYLTPLSQRDLSEISEESFDLPFLNPKEQTRSNSCGGLLFIFDVTGHSYLCNPTTKQIQIFPPKEASPSPNYETSLAGGCVGYDSKSDDYKILRIWDRDYWPSGYYITNRTFELYSLRNDSWKEIPSPASMCNSGILEVIYVRGKCYWLSVPASGVISFDFSEESFSYLPLPRKAHSLCFCLVKFNDEDLLGIVFCGRRGARRKIPLALGSEPGYYFEVWVWREGLRCWDTMFNVSLGGAVAGAEGTIYGRFLFLLGMAGCNRYDDLNRLVVYDWTKKECKELGIYNYHNTIDVFCYVESIVALPHGKPIYECRSPILNYGYLGKDDHDECERICSSPYDSLDEAEEADLDDFAANGFRVVNDIELKDEEEEDEEEVVTNGNMPYAYFSPNYGYAQSRFYPYNPYIPGAMIGADGSIISTQHYYGLPSYANPVTLAPRPYVVANGIVHSYIGDGHNVALNTPNSSLSAMGDASGAKILSEGRVNMGTGKQHPASSITSGSNSITSQAAPVPHVATNRNMPYAYYGYGQSRFYPYNPYIPGAMIGADGSIISTQHHYGLPSYETLASYLPPRPDVVANGIVHSFIGASEAAPIPQVRLPTTAVSNESKSEMVNVVLIGSIPVSLVRTTPTLLHEQVCMRAGVYFTGFSFLIFRLCG